MSECIGVDLEGTLAETTEREAADYIGHPLVGRTGIPNFNLQVRLCSGERLWVDMSTAVWQNPQNQHLLATHLARDVTRQKRTERATEKMLQMCRQFNKIAEKAVPAAAPVSALSEQELHILRLFSSGKNSAVYTQAITGGL